MEVPKLRKRFHMPKGGEGFNCKTFVMRELDANDELEAAIWADKLKSTDSAGTMEMLGAEQREAIRLSLVSVDGDAVNFGGIPFSAMNSWNLRTMRLVRQAFGALNGLDEKDVEDFMAGAEVVIEPTPESE